MECLFLWSPLGFADMGSVSTKHLRAKYGEIRERVCQSGRGGFLQVASWLYELADPELTAMYAESQDKNARPAVSCEMVFATRS